MNSATQVHDKPGLKKSRQALVVCRVRGQHGFPVVKWLSHDKVSFFFLIKNMNFGFEISYLEVSVKTGKLSSFQYRFRNMFLELPRERSYLLSSNQGKLGLQIK